MTDLGDPGSSDPGAPESGLHRTRCLLTPPLESRPRGSSAICSCVFLSCVSSCCLYVRRNRRAALSFLFFGIERVCQSYTCAHEMSGQPTSLDFRVRAAVDWSPCLINLGHPARLVHPRGVSFRMHRLSRRWSPCLIILTPLHDCVFAFFVVCLGIRAPLSCAPVYCIFMCSRLNGVNASS